MEWLFNLTYLTIGIGILILLNLVLLFWMLRLSKHYNSLVKGLDKKSLMSALEGIQKTLSTHERGLASQKKDILKLGEDGQLHLQKLTLKRFNPFSDTGGDQSFILGILDAHKDGVIITSLHSRENTRFYVKSIKDGDGVDHPLSKEEQKIVNS
ncbi:MAG: DUF4446 family protein [bacterium]